MPERAHDPAGCAGCEVVDQMGTYPGRTERTEHPFEETTVPDPRHDPRDPAFDLTPTPDGTGITEQDPQCCHHGHPLTPGHYTRGWQPCGSTSHRGHRTWECWHQHDGQRCGDIVQWPPRGPGCTPVGGYGVGGDT